MDKRYILFKWVKESSEHIDEEAWAFGYYHTDQMWWWINTMPRPLETVDDVDPVRLEHMLGTFIAEWLMRLQTAGAVHVIRRLMTGPRVSCTDDTPMPGWPMAEFVAEYGDPEDAWPRKVWTFGTWAEARRWAGEKPGFRRVVSYDRVVNWLGTDWAGKMAPAVRKSMADFVTLQWAALIKGFWGGVTPGRFVPARPFSTTRYAVSDSGG